MTKHFNLEEFATQTFDDVPEEINLPPGEYLFEVLKAKVDKTQSDQPKGYIELTMRPVDVISGDLDSEALNNVYPVKDSLFLSEKARKFTKRTLEKAFGLDLTGMSYVDIAEKLIGASVVGVTTTEDFTMRSGETGQRVRVTTYKAA